MTFRWKKHLDEGKTSSAETLGRPQNAAKGIVCAFFSAEAFLGAVTIVLVSSPRCRFAASYVKLLSLLGWSECELFMLGEFVCSAAIYPAGVLRMLRVIYTQKYFYFHDPRYI